MNILTEQEFSELLKKNPDIAGWEHMDWDNDITHDSRMLYNCHHQKMYGVTVKLGPFKEETWSIRLIECLNCSSIDHGGITGTKEECEAWELHERENWPDNAQSWPEFVYEKEKKLNV